MAYPQYVDNGGIAAAQDDYVDVPFPATVNQYDILIATILDADDDTFIAPTGWTEVATVNGAIASTVAVFWRRADGTETGVQRFYSNSASGLVMGGAMARYSGCIRTGTPYEGLQTAGVTFSSTVALPAVTTTGVERLVVASIGIEDNKTIATATDYTEDFHLESLVGSDLAINSQSQEFATAGATQARTAELAGSIAENWATVSIALIPTAKHVLIGGINVLSVVAGNLKRKVHLAGAISASSAVSGDVKAIRGLAGAIQAAATVVGAITMTAALTGSIEATSTVSGDLKGRYKLEGAISAQSTVYGNLIRIGPTWPLEGHIEEQSDVFGDSMYPVPQWTLIEEFTGTSYGDVMGYDADNQFLAMAWIPQEDVTLAGIQVWLSQEDKLPPETPMAGAIWRDGGEGQGPEPWGEIDFSAMTERHADRIADGTSNTGGGLYTFEFSLYDDSNPRLYAGEKYYFIFYPYFNGTTPDQTIWWQGDGVFRDRNQRWIGDETAEAWTRQFGGTRFIRIFAAQNQVHSLEGHVAAQSTIEGDLYIPRTYYVRADGSSSKIGATSPNSSSTSMSPATFAASTFIAKEIVVWSAKGGTYKNVQITNASFGSSKYPILMRGEFSGENRPLITSGQEAATWEKVIGEDRWWSVEPPTSMVLADREDLGEPEISSAQVNLPGEWIYSVGEGRLYMGGATSPSSQYSEILTHDDTGAPVLEINGSNWVLEDLLFGLGYGSASTNPAGLEVSGNSNITLRRVGAISCYGIGIDARNVSGLRIENPDVDSCVHNIDVSNSTNSANGGVLISGGFAFDARTIAVEMSNASVIVGQAIEKLATSGSERNFVLGNIHQGLIDRCHMSVGKEGNADVLLGGVYIDGAVTGTDVRNCWIDGGSLGMQAAIVMMDPFGAIQIALTHNLITECTNGAAFQAQSGAAQTEIFSYNNTIINAAGAFFYISGTNARFWFHNNICANYRYMLDQPIAGFTLPGTAGGAQGVLSFAYNHYHDYQKSLIFADEYVPKTFGQWSTSHGEYNSFEQNPRLEDPSSGKYWLAQISPAEDSCPPTSIVGGELALVPATGWTDVNVADQDRYPPEWNRGAYAGDLYLAGDIEAQSSLEGDLRVYRTPVSLEGHIVEVSALYGDLTILQSGVALPLVGSINAKSSVFGDLFAPTKWSLEGHIEAKSYFYGDLYTPDRHYLEGHVAAQSALHGLLEQNYLWSLAGAIEAQSSLSGDVLVTRKIEGHIAAQSALAGNLSVRHKLEGAIAAQSVVSGDLKGKRLLEGHISAQSSVYGSLHAHRGLEGHIASQSELVGDIHVRHSLAGAINAQSSLSGDLKGKRLLEGHIAAQSTVYGALGRIHPLAGAIAAQSTLFGDLTQIEALWDLEGHIAAQSALAGDLIVRQTLAIDDAVHGHAADNLGLTQHHVLAIDGATHQHIADPLDLVENIDLFIDDALHAHLADEPTIAVIHHLEINDALHFQFAEAINLVEGITLSIDSATHGHTADGLSLSQDHVLAIDDSLHAHAVDQLALGGTGYLGINSALHGHTAENIGLNQAHDLVVDDAAHSHQADNVTIAVHSFLAIEDAAHGHTSEEPVFSQTHVLGIDDALHGHTAGEPTLAVTSFLAVDDALHSHASDNLDLIENIDLVIDGATHQHTADGIALISHHVLAIDDAAHAHAADNLGLIQGITLVIDDAAHAHVADGLTLAEKSYLNIQDAFHLHLAENTDLVSGIQLVIDSAVHGHTADQVGISVGYLLEIDDALHLHLGEHVPISTMYVLGISSATHAHHADQVTLGQVHSISIDDASHGHAADELALAQNSDLVIDSALHGHTTEALDLPQVHALEIDSCLHDHAADPCDLTPAPILVIADALHMHWADVVSLTQHHELAIDEAVHEVTSDEILLSQVHSLVIDSCVHEVTSDEVAIQHNHILEIDDAAHAHTADGVALAQKSYLVIDSAIHAVTSPEIEVVSLFLLIDDATHAVTSDEIPIVVGFYLEIDDALHGHTAEELTFIQHHILGVDDALHAVESDELELETPWYQTQRAAAVAGEACIVANVGPDCIAATLDEDCIDVRIHPSEEECT